jgi:hypothetical protein
VAGVAAVLLEMTGVSLPPFVWALVGASLTQAYSRHEASRTRTIVQVVLSCLAGAGLAVGAAEFSHVTGMHAVNLLALIFGAFAQPALQALWNKLAEKINAI